MREDKVTWVDVDEIELNPFNVNFMNEKEYEDLKESLKRHGVVAPLPLAKVGDKLYPIDGNYRVKAAKEVGMKKVPAEVRELKSLEELLVMSVDMARAKGRKNPLALARLFNHLINRGWTMGDIAEKFHFSREYIRTLLSIRDKLHHDLRDVDYLAREIGIEGLRKITSYDKRTQKEAWEAFKKESKREMWPLYVFPYFLKKFAQSSRRKAIEISEKREELAKALGKEKVEILEKRKKLASIRGSFSEPVLKEVKKEAEVREPEKTVSPTPREEYPIPIHTKVEGKIMDIRRGELVSKVYVRIQGYDNLFLLATEEMYRVRSRLKLGMILKGTVIGYERRTPILAYLSVEEAERRREEGGFDPELLKWYPECFLERVCYINNVGREELTREDVYGYLEALC